MLSHQKLNPGTKLLPFVFGGQCGGDRPAAFVAEDHEQQCLQMRPRVLQAPRNLRRDHVAGHAHNKEFTQARVEKQLRRHARVAATEDRRVRPLSLGEIGQQLAPERTTPHLAPEKPLVPLHQAGQRLLGGDLDALES